MYTDKMRMTGLSGIDTDSMIQQLMKAESMKMTTLQKTRDRTAWKQEAYRATSSYLSEFSDKFLSLTNKNSFRYSASYRSFSSTVSQVGSNEDVKSLIANATSSANAGSYDLKVLSTAQKDIYRGEAVSSSYIEGDSAFDPSKLSAGSSFSIKMDNGSFREIKFTAADLEGTKEEVVEKLNKKLATMFSKDADGVAGSQRVSAKLTEGGMLQLQGNNGHTITLEDKAGTLNNMGISNSVKRSTSFDVKGSLSSVFGSDFPSGKTNVSFSINGVDFSFDRTTTVDQMIEKVNASGAGVNMTYNNYEGRFIIESKNTGEKSAIEFDDADGFLSSALKIDVTGNSRSIDEIASDARVVLNGEVFSSSNNKFVAKGIDISLTRESVGNDFTISVASDTSKAKETIKSFVEEYNKIVEYLNLQVATPRAKNGKYSYYEPLSSDEKKAMSEDEIEKWEKEAKEGLLNRDSIVTGIMSEMRKMMYEKVTLEDGSKIALYEIGITTEGYSNGCIGTLQIDDAKLEKALAERGDDIAELFSKSTGNPAVTPEARRANMSNEGLALRLDYIIKNAVSVGGSIYEKAGKEGVTTQNDLTVLLGEQDEAISRMLDSLYQKETNYYQMFGRLEAAMSQADSQMASLQAMLGM